ncbi:MAG: hypothetical protein QW794_08515 [Thermosphaera sp.]
MNPVYEKYGVKRQGCLSCTNSKSWREYVGRISERMLRYIEEKMKEWGVQRERVRLNKVAEKMKLNLGNLESLYVVREY